jgi:MFS family permease
MTSPRPGSQSFFGLDALNFFLADVRDGVGPYLAIFLLTERAWNAADIGVAVSAMGVASLIAQTPAGGWMDRTKHKKLTVAAASAGVAVSCALMTRYSSYGAILFLQALCGIAAAFLAPGIAGLTLGLVGYRGLARRTGRNESFNHAGNVFAALAAGALGTYLSQAWIFYLVAAMSLLSVGCVFLIKDDEIDHDQARGLGDRPKEEPPKNPETYRDLARDRKLLWFVAAMALFHFANAAMLPLVGQVLSKRAPESAAFYMSACIVIAQLVMIPVAVFAGRFSDTWGRKPVFLLGLLALPLRGYLYTLGSEPGYLLAVQALDGFAAGVFGVLSVLVVADLTRGSGRYNLALGAVATATGLGASLSNAVTGYIVTGFGFNPAFLFLAALAVLAATLFWFFVPETCAAAMPAQVPDAA